MSFGSNVGMHLKTNKAGRQGANLVSPGDDAPEHDVGTAGATADEDAVSTPVNATTAATATTTTTATSTAPVTKASGRWSTKPLPPRPVLATQLSQPSVVGVAGRPGSGIPPLAVRRSPHLRPSGTLSPSLSVPDVTLLESVLATSRFWTEAVQALTATGATANASASTTTLVSASVVSAMSPQSGGGDSSGGSDPSAAVPPAAILQTVNPEPLALPLASDGTCGLQEIVARLALSFPENDRTRHQQPLAPAYEPADTFFMTHPWFTTAEQLMACFDEALDPSVAALHTLGAATVERIKAAACRLLRYWIERYPETLEGRAERLLFERFVGRLQGQGHQSLAVMLDEARQIAFSTRPVLSATSSSDLASSRSMPLSGHGSLAAPEGQFGLADSDRDRDDIDNSETLEALAPAASVTSSLAQLIPTFPAPVAEPTRPPELPPVSGVAAAAAAATALAVVVAVAPSLAASVPAAGPAAPAEPGAAASKSARRGAAPPPLSLAGTVPAAAADPGPAIVLPAWAPAGWAQAQDLLGMPSLGSDDLRRGDGSSSDGTSTEETANVAATATATVSPPLEQAARPAAAPVTVTDPTIRATTTTASRRPMSMIVTATQLASALTAAPAPEPTMLRHHSSFEFNFVDAPTAAIASQLAYLDFQLYRQIRPIDFFRYRGPTAGAAAAAATTAAAAAAAAAAGGPSRPRRRSVSGLPTVGDADADGSGVAEAEVAARSALEKSISHFNAVALWAVQMILNEPTSKGRGRVMTKFIKIAKKLWLLRDYNTMMAVHAGLTHRSVHRLRQTFAEVPKKHQTTLVQLQAFLSYDNNFHTYRQELAQQRGFCVPYMGVVLSDMVHLKDVVRASIRTSVTADAVPWTRVVACANVLRRALSFQQAPVPFKPLEHLVRVLRVSLIPVVNEDELVELSREREPPPAPLPVAGPAAPAAAPARAVSVAAGSDALSPPGGRPAVNPTAEAVSAALSALVLSPQDPEADDATADPSGQIEDMVNAIFDTFDVDGNNAINQEEFRNLASYFPFVYSFGTLDTDRDGLITREELLGFFLKARNPRYNEQLHKLVPHSLRLAPTTRCDVCSRSVWSLTSTYYRCSKCGICCHQRCRDLITSTCHPPSRNLLATFASGLGSALAAAVTTTTGGGADSALVSTTALLAAGDPAGSVETSATAGAGDASVPGGDVASAALSGSTDAAAGAAPSENAIGPETSKPSGRAGFASMFSLSAGSSLAPRNTGAPPTTSPPSLARARGHARNRSESASTVLPSGPLPSSFGGSDAVAPSSLLAGPTAATLADWAGRLHRTSLELEMRLQEEEQLLEMARAWLDDDGSDPAWSDVPDLRDSFRTVARQLAHLNHGSRASSAALRAVLVEMGYGAPAAPGPRPPPVGQ